VILGLVVLLGVAGTLMSGGGTETTPSGSTATAKASAVAAKPAASPVLVNAVGFAAEFDANQPAAEAKWGGQRVTMSAKITNIDTGRVSFGDLGKPGEFTMTQISCALKDKGQALKVKNGQRVKITGTVGSQFVGVIDLKDCVIG
jgi:hypothetical protein